MKRGSRNRGFRILSSLLSALLIFTLCSCDGGSSSSSSSGGCDTGSSSSSSSSSSGGGSGANIALSASASTSYVSSWETLSAVNDNSYPASSSDKSSGAYGNWNNPNSLQWVQYDWNQNYTLSATEVYWFDDNGGVLTPTTAYVEYFNGSQWVRCGEVPKVKNAWNRLALNNITTYRLRISMLNSAQSTGILEWRVWGVPAGGAVPTPTPTPTATPNPSEPAVFQPASTGPGGSAYKDAAHFRIYATSSSADIALAHMEAAYKCFVTDWGFRSTGLSTHDSQNDGPYYKMNIYPKAMSAGGYMQYDANQGLAYLEVNSGYVTDPKIIVHEYGHGLTIHEINWMDQTRTGAWWETVANWVADTYLNSSYYEEVRQRYGLGAASTIIELNKVIGQSYLTIVHDQNYYQAWPFLTYLVNNPDNYHGAGRMVVPDLFRNHRRNNETPLHVLERIASPIRVQTIVGRYWARMAFLDIGHPRAQQAFLNSRGSLNFANLDSLGNQTYRVKSDRRPMYGGANIMPLAVTGNGVVEVDVTNLGNGLQGSNFTATLAIRSSNGSVRYVDLPDGFGQASVGANEEASLVVVNTPDSLIQYDAFQSGSNSPESIGLNYQVQITGAVPTDY